jgi:hypothetical protein
MGESPLEKALGAPLPGQRTPPGECLDDLASARFVAGTLPPAEYERAAEHVSLCDPCLERIAVTVTLDRTDAEDTQPVPAQQREIHRRATPRRIAPFAMAASLLAVLVAGLLLSNPSLLPGAASDDYRAVRASGASTPVPALLSPVDGTTLRRADLDFAWAQIDGALYYEVEILSGDGDTLWQARASTNREHPPESLYLEPGKTFYVWVRAYLADGKTVKSPAVSFALLTED